MTNYGNCLNDNTSFLSVLELGKHNQHKESNNILEIFENSDSEEDTDDVNLLPNNITENDEENVNSGGYTVHLEK